MSVCLPVCLSVCTPPFFSTRPSDRNQIWHTYSGRHGTHSQLKKFDPAHPRGNITSYVICDVIERRVCEAFKNYRSTFDDVILRNVGGLIGDFARAPPSLPPLPPSPPTPSLASLPPLPPIPPSPLPSLLLPPSLPSLSHSLPPSLLPSFLLPSFLPSLSPIPPLSPLPPSQPASQPPTPPPLTPPPLPPSQHPSLPSLPSLPSSRAKPGNRLVDNDIEWHFLLKAKMWAISSDSHQLHYIPKHHFII